MIYDSGRGQNSVLRESQSGGTWLRTNYSE